VRTAIILAGGLGTRLREVVSEVPKPMAIVNERPFLAHVMDYWKEQGITRFVLSVGYLKDAIVSHFGCSYHGAKIEYVVEERPLGTGGGYLLAIEKIQDNDYFVLLNGDTFFEVELSKLIVFAEKNDADCFSADFNCN
jgi:D-glycero-alpha-D-manno-heptose 1-phosphate guanylyltransferase